MAKKKAPAKKQPAKQLALPIDDTVDLVADQRNPREISVEAAAGLRNSLKRFGDLSGIVWNKRTKILVTGHQRMEQIREEYGDRPIEVLDGAAELGCIRIDETHVFSVRIVDWSEAKHRMANAEANNQKVAGRFTGDLAAYLTEVQASIEEEDPGALDELLLSGFLDGDEEEIKNVELPEQYQVLVDLESEEQQQEVHELLTKKGWKCRVLTV